MATADALTDTDKIITAAEKFGDKLAQMATQYGPDVADVALAAARVDALSGLLPAAAVAVVGALTIPHLYRIWREGARIGAHWNAYFKSSGATEAPKPTIENGLDDGDYGHGKAIFGGCAMAGAVLATGAACVFVLNPWRWVGIFEPKVWLAGKLLGWM